ncbi:hypothetical protein KO02_00130 [Sphingobacterium sp. ML3W]|uniref:hypothetical protein n=1 Tax=Sphingobacterium sp. ML3W TaxID=1538644 RepID=UPI0004F8406B|nr:hypothetical protein [Sphingobacterium sp. ML3W]AIM35250.1 hypothetical protein KO02_00130 [Sphingobacterium sp. ML3W]
MKSKFYNFLYCCFALLVFSACKKTDDFKTRLDELPQINNQPNFAYLPAYGIGDTMTIVGRLQPQNNLKIQVGEVDAQIVETDTVSYTGGSYPTFTKEIMDIAKVIITEKMGIGANRRVKITTGGNSIDGASIEIYALAGQGSFNTPLKIVDHVTMSSNSNVFLHCINGKGDLYVFDAPSKSIQLIKKDGQIITLLTQAQLTTDQNGSFIINDFIAGGVDPKGENAWFSVQTPQGYRFCKAVLSSKVLTTLNSSNSLEAPYEGDIIYLKTIISGVFPDSKGNVYVTVGDDKKKPVAIASINDGNKQLKFIFKSRFATSGMPGNNFSNAETQYSTTQYRFSPEEGSLYVFSTRIVLIQGEVGFAPGLGIYSLINGLKSKDLVVQDEGRVVPVRFTGPFNQMRMMLNFNRDPMDTGSGFGYLPMPGQRLQFLFTQYLDGSIINKPGNFAKQYGFPKWMVLDFKHEKSYQYAPGPTDVADYTFEPYYGSVKREGLPDELLNYDEEGNLYMSANGRTAIVKTAIQ